MIDFQNVEDLTRRLKSGKALRERYSIPCTEKEAANGIYAAFRAQVEIDGETVKKDPDTLEHILSAARWLSDPNGKSGLMLMGLYGNGKTTLAKGIANLVEYETTKRLGYSDRLVVYFHKAKDVCRLCKMAEKNPEAYRALFTEKFIIIDDLGAEPNDVLVYGMPETPIADVLSERFDKRLMTIVTTNLNADELKAKYKGRMYDRFRQMFKTIIFENESYRQ